MNKKEKQTTEINDNAIIKVIGVGGAGNNTIKTMLQKNIQGVELFIANTDKQALDVSTCKQKVLLGKNITNGLGAGANPQIGTRAANESVNEIRKIVEHTDIVFVTCGMGGGTGTGAAPVIAKIAKEAGALTIGVVSKPFTFEGRKRLKQAMEGIEELRKNVDSIVIVSNNQLTELLGRRPITESFLAADNVLSQGVETITDLILKDSLINLDFNDIKTVMKDRGTALIGIGDASGEDCARKAAKMAVNSPLLETKLSNATDAIVNITGGPNMSLFDANDAIECIREEVGDDLDIIFGVRIDEKMEDLIQVTLIATGFEEDEENMFAPKEIKKVISEDVEQNTSIPHFRKRTSTIESSPLFMENTTVFKKVSEPTKNTEIDATKLFEEINNYQSIVEEQKIEKQNNENKTVSKRPTNLSGLKKMFVMD